MARTALPSGTVFPILARPEGVGWLESGWEDVDPTVVGRPALRYYRLALAILPRSARSRYAAEWRADLAQLPEDPTATRAYARSLLRGAPELRRAPSRAEGGIPLRCRQPRELALCEPALHPLSADRRPGCRSTGRGEPHRRADPQSGPLIGRPTTTPRSPPGSTRQRAGQPEEVPGVKCPFIGSPDKAQHPTSRWASQPSTWSMPIRSCTMVSRSRMVTAWSCSVSKSTVMQ